MSALATSGRRLALSLALLALAGCQPSAESVAAKAAQAQQLLDAGQPREAQAIIAAAIAQRDDIPAALLVQAHVALALQNRGLAYQAYSNALALDATNDEALNAVAQLGLGTGHLREAESAADKILILQSDQVGALTVKALIAIVRNDLDTANTLADRILRRQPGDLGGLILKSRIQALRGDLGPALETLRAGETQYSSTSSYVMAVAELLRARGDTQGLLQQLQRLKTLAPDDLGYRLDLVDILYRTGHRDEARDEVATLIAKPIKDAATIDGIVRLWYANDRAAMTPAMIDAASRNASAEARLVFARYFIASGQPAVAATLLKPLATGWSSDIQGLYALAGAALGSPDAGAAADALLAKDPGNGGALLTRIRQAMAEGRPRDAVTDAQRVVADYPQWDEGYLTLAAAYAALRDQVGVRRAYEQGLKARPQSIPLTAAYITQLIALRDGPRAVEVARRFALDSPALPAGWSQYAATCARATGDDCRDEAAQGLAASRTRYGLDPTPGTSPPIAAIGRLQ